MGAKPDKVCVLEKEKLIDGQTGFVDTFNWLVSFCSNLKGENGIKVDTKVSDHPVVKRSGAEDGESGDGGDDTLTFESLTDNSKWSTSGWPKIVNFGTASDSNVKITIEDGTIKIGVYYV